MTEPWGETSRPQRAPRLPDPGWLSDPAETHLERYWDGSRWTGRTRDRVSKVEMSRTPSASYAQRTHAPVVQRRRARWVRPAVLTLAVGVIGMYVYQLALAHGYVPEWANVGRHVAAASRPSAPDVAYPVYGSSELVTYIAAHAVAQSERINVTHWARAHGTEHVADAFFESATQNPYAFVDGYHVSDNGTTVILEPTYTYSAEEAEHRRAVTSQAVATGLAVSGADVATTDTERVTRIHDYVTTVADYDYTAYELINDSVFDDPRVIQSQEAYGIFAAGTAVCNGYAQAFLAMARAAGLDAVLVTGTASSGMTVGNHAWNKVHVDGQWLVVDATWNDPVAGRAPGREYLMIPPGDAALVTRVEDANWVLDAALPDYA